ncbi:hypothetical protein EVAR_57908_1 [Eumeta japonica]|uniref:Uncharacterized protein n=1 Tax=Eumeta variegata TaxID=151549 RepID=A0A4C1ZLV9_EUMVA|nr:hypothetical protein EVAR_57908_1 [Eumeta japonica]
MCVCTGSTLVAARPLPAFKCIIASCKRGDHIGVVLRNQEEETTLAQSTIEIRKAADELFQLSEMDVKACTKQRKRRTKEKRKEHTLLTIFIDTLKYLLPIPNPVVPG